MARFVPTTYSTFLQRMANRVVARTELTDLVDGGGVHTLLAAAAREFDEISYQTQNVHKVWDIDDATGQDLDDRGKDFPPDADLDRYPAEKATGDVVFSRSGTSGSVTIPVGTEVFVPGGGPKYVTTAVGTITSGNTDSGSVAIEAVEAGSDGSTDADTITGITGVTGVETVTNPAALTGQDEESDDDYRARMKAWIRSLPRGTPDALKYAVLGATLPGSGTVRTVEVVELAGDDLGKTYVYADDGTGTISETDNNSGSPETVIASASGGEVRIYTDNAPIPLGSSFALEKNAGALTEGTDYTLNRATGQITLDTALSAADTVTAEYTWYTGLIAQAQKIVDGDPGDRTNYPGYRAGGTQVFVIPPTVFQQVVVGTIILDEDYVGSADDVITAAKAAVNRYINSLPINGDVIHSEIIAAVQSVAGVKDVILTTPTANVILGSGQLARVRNSNIDFAA